MSGKWPGFDSNKQNLNAFHMLNKLKPLTRLWSDAKHMFSFLKFCSYFKANGPDSFHFLLKVLLPSKFISKSISWPLKWPRNNKAKFVAVLFTCCFVARQLWTLYQTGRNQKYRPKQDHTFLSYSRGNHMGANFRLYYKQYCATAFGRYQTGRNQKCRPKQDHTLISYSCGNHMGANFRLYHKQYYATAFWPLVRKEILIGNTPIINFK